MGNVAVHGEIPPQDSFFAAEFRSFVYYQAVTPVYHQSGFDRYSAILIRWLTFNSPWPFNAVSNLLMLCPGAEGHHQAGADARAQFIGNSNAF